MDTRWLGFGWYDDTVSGFGRYVFVRIGHPEKRHKVWGRWMDGWRPS